MNIVCEECGDVGYKHLLVYCKNCKITANHQYCMDTIVFDGSLANWLCCECQSKHEVSIVSSVEVSNQRQLCHPHLDSHTIDQLRSKTNDSLRGLTLWGTHRSRSYKTRKLSQKKSHSSGLNALQRELIESQSDVRPRNNNASSRDWVPGEKAKCNNNENIAKKQMSDILNYEIAVQPENLKPQSFKDYTTERKHGRHEENSEATLQPENLNPLSTKSYTPAKKRRKYIEANEDEDAVVGDQNAGYARSDITGITTQTMVAKDHYGGSRMPLISESANQQSYICTQPIDKPVWSGIFKISREEFVSLAAHLSTKACERVWEFSRTLCAVVEVTKLSRSEAWPKNWEASGPTDDSIGLYFFPHNMSPNEQLDQLVKEVTENDTALKAIVGGAELMIFSSILLPEQYQTFKMKHFLWGVFRRRKDIFDRDVVREEQVGAACTAEKGEVQEQQVSVQRDEVQCEASDQEVTVVKHVTHLDNQPLVDLSHDTEKEAFITGTGEAAEMNSPEVESKCSRKSDMGHDLQVPEEVHQQEDTQEFKFSSGSNTMPHSEPSSMSPCAFVTAKLNKSADHRQSHSTVGASPAKLFGFVVAQTPRSEQIIQEMQSEGALFFAVQEGMMSCGSRLGKSSSVGFQPIPNNESRIQPMEFVSTDKSDVASDACLELFPVQQRADCTPRAEASKEVDLNLSLGAHLCAPSMLL